MTDHLTTTGALPLNAATRRLRQLLEPPRHRLYRECADGWIVGWLTEPFDGRYASLVWKPVGPGSRTPGAARRWDLVSTLTGVHRTRRQAKARATRLWQQHEARGLARVTSTSDE